MAYSSRHVSEAHSPHHRSVPKLPLIPDLRFESTFLRNIRPFVHLPSDPTSEEHGDLTAHAREVRIEWAKVTWVTLRDVVLSPLMWGTASAFAKPLLQIAYASLQHSRASLARSVHDTLGIREGAGAAWLRGWASGLLGSVQQSVSVGGMQVGLGAR